jgi:elongation factor P
MATTNDLKNGMTLDIEGQLWNVVEFQHVKPGKGPAFVRTKLKSVMTGKVVDRTFNAGVKVEVAILEKRDMTYLYRDGDDFVFMDDTTFDQMNISEAVVGEAVNYMLENCKANVAVHEGNPLYVELPASVEMTVTYTEPGLQGDRSSGGTKPATIDTGITIQVPLFIKQDERILVDTRTGDYLGRANS